MCETYRENDWQTERKSVFVRHLKRMIGIQKERERMGGGER